LHQDITIAVRPRQEFLTFAVPCDNIIVQEEQGQIILEDIISELDRNNMAGTAVAKL
jgi:hypothetical protein